MEWRPSFWNEYTLVSNRRIKIIEMRKQLVPLLLFTYCVAGSLPVSGQDASLILSRPAGSQTVTGSSGGNSTGPAPSSGSTAVVGPAAVTFAAQPPPPPPPGPVFTSAGGNVTLQDCGTHFDVVLDFEKGASHRQIGEEYGELLRKHVPQFEKELDSYITEFARNWFVYKIGLRRVGQVKPQLSQQYKDEIEGIASRLTGGTTNALGDGKISKDELYLYNLLGDVARLFQCSALAVYGDSSASGKTVVGRNFDWPPGRQNQLSQVQSVVTVKAGEKSFVNVACLGFQGAVTAFNRYGVFASVNDSPTGAHFSAKKRRSYLLDLRQALEENRTVDGVAQFMSDPKKLYSCNHIITLAEPDKAVILENNLGRKKGIPVRAVRTSDSPMHEDVSWGIPDSVGAVNCFRLKVADDNRLSAFSKRNKLDPNTGRWENLKEQLKSHGPKITADGVKEILSFHHPNSASIMRGDIYNRFTVQSVVFEPETMHLSVAFRRRDGILTPQLPFENIPVKLVPQSAVTTTTLPSVVSTGGSCQHE
jgi:hypothetical protein